MENVREEIPVYLPVKRELRTRKLKLVSVPETLIVAVWNGIQSVCPFPLLSAVWNVGGKIVVTASVPGKNIVGTALLIAVNVDCVVTVFVRRAKVV